MTQDLPRTEDERNPAIVAQVELVVFSLLFALHFMMLPESYRSTMLMAAGLSILCHVGFVVYLSLMRRTLRPPILAHGVHRVSIREFVAAFASLW